MITQSDDFGVLQRLVDALYKDTTRTTHLDVELAAEAHDLPADLLEIVRLLPPGGYTRQRLCDQFNSAISGHGWGLVYGTVE
jgi:hypothetical protein